MRLLCFVLIFVGVCFSLCACAAIIQNDYAQEVTESIVDGIVDGDYDVTRAMFKDIASDEEFDAFFATVSPLLGDTNDYELRQVGWHTRLDNGISTYSVTFEMHTGGGDKYMIETHFLKDDNSLYYFNILPAFLFPAGVTLFLQIVFAVISLAACVFCIWMIVDCANRKMKNKALWIILILLSLSITATIGNDWGIRFMLRLVFPISKIMENAVSVSLRLTVPIGAIIYFILRKELTQKMLEAEAAERMISEPDSEALNEAESSDSETEQDS